ncbi:META domain-containing protein [Aliivibrio finisterrensis]|uniref:META domain-containing protein n=1 Tax=Aliivibrio finisterrensis TaxID=511998 RepID=UPI0010221225|nr:META domain-containing protein [Aliivibrio finisterrensis]RYU71158.1 META domain-containing protein [Aliivibrio finisterrensis]RYU74887.1 META domain-containing protein [Aliivibrio finisterrensis]RYU77332.1 META domain-containing protein [Aliivibrio finisterrensis]
MKKLLVAVSLPVLMAACASNGDNTADAQVSADMLQHHNWQLTQVDGKDVTVSEEEMEAPRLEIGEKMTANGNAGCNNFFGQAELNAEGQFRIEKMGMTMKMCMGDVMTTEQVMSSTLSTWSDITLTKENLILKGQDHELTFTLRDWVN